MADSKVSAAGNADEDQSKRAPPLRAEFNDTYIKRLRLSRPPLGYESGKLVFAKDDNSQAESPILWDASRNAPQGFGVKVTGKKTYILRRKILGKSILAKVGSFGDYNVISKARPRAADTARQTVETGRKNLRGRTIRNELSIL